MNTLVSFELAKLLKEEGFDLPVCNVFETSMLHGRECYFFEKEYELDKHNKQDGENTNYYSRPTIAEVVMWLYEKHQIWIETPFWDSKFRIKVVDIKNETVLKGIDFNQFNTPTEAYEEAIKYTLKNLIP